MVIDWIDLAGAHNVRALTGLPAGRRRTRPSALLRGDRPDDLTEADIATLRDLIGLRAVVDLRTTAELPTGVGGPDPELSARDIEAVLDLLDAADGGAPGYLGGLGCSVAELARLGELVLEPSS